MKITSVRNSNDYNRIEEEGDFILQAYVFLKCRYLFTGGPYPEITRGYVVVNICTEFSGQCIPLNIPRSTVITRRDVTLAVY